MTSDPTEYAWWIEDANVLGFLVIKVGPAGSGRATLQPDDTDEQLWQG